MSSPTSEASFLLLHSWFSTVLEETRLDRLVIIRNLNNRRKGCRVVKRKEFAYGKGSFAVYDECLLVLFVSDSVNSVNSVNSWWCSCCDALVCLCVCECV